MLLVIIGYLLDFYVVVADHVTCINCLVVVTAWIDGRVGVFVPVMVLRVKELTVLVSFWCLSLSDLEVVLLFGFVTEGIDCFGFVFVLATFRFGGCVTFRLRC